MTHQNSHLFNDPPPPNEISTISSYAKKYSFYWNFLTQGNVTNLRIYENIGVPPPPIDDAIGEPTTGRVSLCNFSIQQTMCAYAKFSRF